MKKLAIAVVLGLFAISLFGCSGSETPAENKTETESAGKAGEAMGDAAGTAGRTEAGGDFK